jgi:hypothetical protein
MDEDPRCCGSGTCIIDEEGRCWCGQQWDGQRMCFVGSSGPSAATPRLSGDEDEDEDADR